MLLYGGGRFQREVGGFHKGWLVTVWVQCHMFCVTYLGASKGHTEQPNTRTAPWCLLAARRAKSYGYIAIQGIYRVRSVLPGVLCGVLFSYEERLETNWYKIFETAATLLEPGSILVIPTIGTNNRMDFFHSAICIWIAMRACLQNEDSALHRLAEIRVLTPWAAEANQSSRTIQHLFNLMRLHGKVTGCRSRGTGGSQDCACCVVQHGFQQEYHHSFIHSCGSRPDAPTRLVLGQYH